MTLEEMGRLLTSMRAALPTWAPKEIDRNLSSMWLALLKDYTDIEIRAALGKAIATLDSWPAPITIKRLCQGETRSDEEIGQDIASRIEGAIGKYGSYNPQKSREAVGEIGWEVVRQLGGWSRICEVEADQMASARRQWRELGGIVSRNYHTSGENLPPALPEKRHPALTAALKLVSTSSGETEGVSVARR